MGSKTAQFGITKRLLNILDILAKQNWVEKLAFFVGFNLKDFLFINEQITITSIIMLTKAKFYVCFTEINTKPFLWWTKASIDTKSWTLLNQ